MEQTTKKSTTVKTIVTVVVAVVVMAAVQQIFFKSPSFDKALMKTAGELNKSCPVMVDQVTRLDNAIAMPGKVFQYNYTLISISKDSIDAKAFEDAMLPNLTNNIKSNPDLKDFRDNKVTMAYAYKDKNQVHIVTIRITPEMYSGK